MSRPNPEATGQTLADWLASGDYTLTLSSGFFGFYAHAGFLAAIEASGARPVAVRGASAGALAGGLWAAGVPAAALKRELMRLRRQDFWDPGLGAGLLRGRKFDDRLRSLLPVQSFGDCAVPLAISVYDTRSASTEVVTEGDLAPAIRASCAVPLMFHPVMINGRPKLDGGLGDRPALHGHPVGARTLCHHLPPSSWRRRRVRRAGPPSRTGMVTVALTGLPRVHPFALERGPAAFELAYAGMSRALGLPASAVIAVIAEAGGS